MKNEIIPIEDSLTKYYAEVEQIVEYQINKENKSKQKLKNTDIKVFDEQETIKYKYHKFLFNDCDKYAINILNFTSLNELKKSFDFWSSIALNSTYKGDLSDQNISILVYQKTDPFATLIISPVDENKKPINFDDVEGDEINAFVTIYEL